VRADKLRFDFAYHEPLGPERLADVEELVNRRIVENHPVRTFTTSLEHARDLGAMALFGEKYGDFVRVVEVDDFSRELCGGTHVGATSELGIFKILSEGSVGANVRRIEAVSGRAAVGYYRDRDRTLGEAVASLGTTRDQFLPSLGKLQALASDLQSEVKQYVSARAIDAVGSLVEGARDMEQLLSLVDRVRDTLRPAAVALGAELDKKAVLVLGVSHGLDRLNAGQIVRNAAREFGGGGGGTAQLGRGGGGDPTRLADAVTAAKAAMIACLET
jgi:alanyl-tRNA synthetase